MKSKPCILIVDDEYFLAEAIQLRLEFEGFSTLLAEDGKKALEVLDQTPVDLVLMDLIMPEMDGITAITHMREDSRFKNIPVIVLSAKARAQDKEETIKVGANDFMIKPFEPKELVAMVRKYLPA